MGLENLRLAVSMQVDGQTGFITGYQGQWLEVWRWGRWYNLIIPPHKIPINYRRRKDKFKVGEPDRHQLDQVVKVYVTPWWPRKKEHSVLSVPFLPRKRLRVGGTGSEHDHKVTIALCGQHFGSSAGKVPHSMRVSRGENRPGPEEGKECVLLTPQEKEGLSVWVILLSSWAGSFGVRRLQRAQWPGVSYSSGVYLLYGTCCIKFQGIYKASRL